MVSPDATTFGRVAAVQDNEQALPRVHIVIPTFKETQYVKGVLSDLARQDYQASSIVVCNCNPGDETSRVVEGWSHHMNIREVEGDSSMYWAGAVDIGLDYLLPSVDPNDWILLLNCDVHVSTGFLRGLAEAAQETPHAMLSGATLYGGRYSACSMTIRSWLLATWDDPLSGMSPNDTRGLKRVKVDMVAGRSMLFPAKLVDEIGGMRPELLPHYGSDYELSRRAALAGYSLFILPQVWVDGDPEHSGINVRRKHATIRQRLESLTSVSSVVNVKYRVRFVRASFPAYSLPISIPFTIARCVFLALFGGMLPSRF